MSLQVLRNDYREVVLRKFNFGMLGLFLLHLVSLAIVGYLLWLDEQSANGPQAVKNFNLALMMCLVCAAEFAVLWGKPYREVMTLDRGTRRLLIRRQRLFATTRDELGFDQVNAVTTETPFEMWLATDDRNHRFPIYDELMASGNPKNKRQAEVYAELVRSVLASDRQIASSLSGASRGDS